MGRGGEWILVWDGEGKGRDRGPGKGTGRYGQRDKDGTVLQGEDGIVVQKG